MEEGTSALSLNATFQSDEWEVHSLVLCLSLLNNMEELCRIRLLCSLSDQLDVLKMLNFQDFTAGVFDMR